MRVPLVGSLAGAIVTGACGSNPVTGPGAVIAVLVTPELDTIAVGGTSQLAVTVVVQDRAATNPDVTWEALHPLVATVSPSGFVTGVGRGPPASPRRAPV